MMPVEELPDASWITAFALGALSAVFDNIPLTKLCLEQGHYDWGMLAYSVGFGGSMIWFGSSAGVAITNKFPEARNVVLWVKKGWHVAAAYVLGFFDCTCCSVGSRLIRVSIRSITARYPDVRWQAILRPRRDR